MKSYRVTLREQKNKSGRTSLYLDIYPPIYDEKKKKETRRKFLDLYLFEKPNNKIEREHNKFTLVKAKKIESEWQMDLLGQTLDMPFISSKDLDFLAYFKSIVKKRYTSKGNYDNWLSTYNYLEDYTKGQCLMSEVDEAFCQGFKDYLDSCYTKKSSAYKLSVNSKYSYFNKFRAAIKQAMEDKHLHHNPILRIKAFPQGESFREFLTLDEVKKLKAVRCDNPVLERAAFWSIRTGMRWGDCLKLRWIDLQYSEDQGYFIRFNQNKTKSYETLPITEEAVKELGNPAGDLQEYVFKGLTYSSHNNFWNNLINEQKLQVLEQVENPIGLPAFVMGKDWWEPSEVRSCLRCLPLRRLPHKRSGSSKCPSISASRAASKNFFNKGAKAPSLP